MVDLGKSLGTRVSLTDENNITGKPITFIYQPIQSRIWTSFLTPINTGMNIMLGGLDND